MLRDADHPRGNRSVLLWWRMGEAERDHHFLQLFFDGLQVVDDALSRCDRDAREGWPLGYLRLGDCLVKRSKIFRRPADDEQQRVDRGMDNLGIRRFGVHSVKSYTLNAMRFIPQVFASMCLLGFAATAAAQPGAVYVDSDKVDAALAKGGVLVDAPQVRVAGGHRDKPGALDTQKGTTILYITDGEGVFVAGARTQRLVKGEVIVVPAGVTQSFTILSPSVSYLHITVPVLASGAKAEVVYADRDKVAATMKKAAPLADGPNLRVSGGFRPSARADASPVAEVHANEADLFYVVEGSATQVLGGTVIDGKQTAPGQIRGPKTEGGQTYRLDRGDIMWVPAGMPHWFPEIAEPLGYLLVKVFY
jgi:quercetin dioxygenase-like cupin family protein